MLLVIDVGNTDTVLGVYQRPAGFKSGEDKMSLRAHWRVATIRTQTVDEYGVLFHNLFSMQHVDAAEVKGIIVSSVVPPLDSTVREVCEKYFRVKPRSEGTRLNSSHEWISYAVFCLKKKKKKQEIKTQI